MLHGTYGTLDINQLGAWTYAINDALPATQALAPGQQAHDIFTVQVTDSAGAFSTRTVDITVTGDNIPSINSGAIAHTFNAGDPSFTALLTATDADHGDRMTWTVVGGTTPQPASYSFQMDEFKITRPGEVVWDDTFSDGLAPPNSAGATSAESIRPILPLGWNRIVHRGKRCCRSRYRPRGTDWKFNRRSFRRPTLGRC